MKSKKVDLSKIPNDQLIFMYETLIENEVAVSGLLLKEIEKRNLGTDFISLIYFDGKKYI
jgi:hypothetical protein